MCGMREPNGWSVSVIPSEIAFIFVHPPMLAQLRFREAEEVSWLAPFLAMEDGASIILRILRESGASLGWASVASPSSCETRDPTP